MIKKVFFFILSLISITGFAQKLNTTLIDSNSLVCDTYIGFDTLGDYYFIKDNVFTKKSKLQLWQYKNITLGKITSVDIINPLQIVLFYEQFNTIILLDNQLNVVQKLDLSLLNNSLIAANVSLSGRNQLWVYNSSNQKLGLYDYNKNTLTEFPIPIQGTIKHTQSDFNSFIWIDNLNNCYSSDIFGKINLLCTVPAYDKIQIIDNERIIFSITHKLYLLNYVKKSIIEIEIVENSFENFYYKEQNLAIFTNQQIKNYKIILP